MDLKENLSQLILDICTKDFIPKKDIPNKEYLEAYLSLLELKAISYRRASSDIEISCIERAKARDMEQNCIGLIHGIKFGIVFLDSKLIDLMAVSNGVDTQNIVEK
jgi:hypothetical protein